MFVRIALSFSFGMIAISGALAVENKSSVDVTGSNEVIVPAYFDAANVQKQTGSIFYDLDLGAFRGVNKLGGLDTLSALNGNAVISSGDERVERVEVASVCSSSPCTITRQSGSWISSITRSGTGDYVLTLDSGIFSDLPTCTCSSGYNITRLCQLTAVSSTTVNLIMTNPTTTSAADSSFNVICMGPR